MRLPRKYDSCLSNSLFLPKRSKRLVSIVARAVDKRGVLPVISHIAIEAWDGKLHLTATVDDQYQRDGFRVILAGTPWRQV